MADVAAVFHWSPAVMDDMEPSDLIRWHALARERAGAV
nr:GpE family phage tail protein [Azospirillum doebereinerae]